MKVTHLKLIFHGTRQWRGCQCLQGCNGCGTVILEDLREGCVWSLFISTIQKSAQNLGEWKAVGVCKDLSMLLAKPSISQSLRPQPLSFHCYLLAWYVLKNRFSFRHGKNVCDILSGINRPHGARDVAQLECWPSVHEVLGSFSSAFSIRRWRQED